MRDAWREAAESAANAEEHAPWWRRLFTSEMNVSDGS
jgi:hypothetical protein